MYSCLFLQRSDFVFLDTSLGSFVDPMEASMTMRADGDGS